MNLKGAFWRLCGWVAVLSATWLIGKPLAMPAHADFSSLKHWEAEQGPLVVAIAAIRAVVLLCGAWLVLSLLLGSIARLSRSARLGNIAIRLSVPGGRRLVAGVVGVSLSIGASTASIAQAAPLPSPSGSSATAQVAAPVMVAIPTTSVHSQLMSTTITPPVMEELPDLKPAVDTAVQTWTIRPGDDIWAVAAHVLSDAWNRKPDDAQIAVMWQAILEANQDRLPVPGNPNLVFPGDVLVIPAVPASPF